MADTSYLGTSFAAPIIADEFQQLFRLAEELRGTTKYAQELTAVFEVGRAMTANFEANQEMLRVATHAQALMQPLLMANQLAGPYQELNHGLEALFRSLNVRGSVKRLEEDRMLAPAGFVHQLENSVLTPKQIFAGWQVPSSRVLVEVGTVPLAVMQEIMRNPQLLRQLDPRQFEAIVAEILHNHGFTNIVLTPRSNDGGKDIIASQILLDIPIVFYFECKQYRQDRPVEMSELRALLGTVSNDKINKGVLVTTSRFTKGGRDFIAQNAMLQGTDYDDLVGWVEKLKK